eukprot:4058252-Prymnesium_polylepis.1
MKPRVRPERRPTQSESMGSFMHGASSRRANALEMAQFPTLKLLNGDELRRCRAETPTASRSSCAKVRCCSGSPAVSFTGRMGMLARTSLTSSGSAVMFCGRQANDSSAEDSDLARSVLCAPIARARRPRSSRDP